MHAELSLGRTEKSKISRVMRVECNLSFFRCDIVVFCTKCFFGRNNFAITMTHFMYTECHKCVYFVYTKCFKKQISYYLKLIYERRACGGQQSVCLHRIAYTCTCICIMSMCIYTYTYMYM